MGTWLPSVIAGVASVFAAIVAAWSAVKVAKVNAESDEKKDEQKKIEQQKKDEEDYKKKLTERIELLETASKCMLRRNIISDYNHYKEMEYIPIYGKENVNEEFEVYKKLHGNGTIHSLVESLENLPTEPKEQ